MTRYCLLLLLALACQPVTQIGSGPGDGIDGGGDTDSDTTDDTDSDVCDEQSFDITVVPPRMMILIDSSSSMFDPIDEEDFASPTKWSVARNAISDLVFGWTGQIHFGLDSFPTSGNCNVNGPVRSDVSIGNPNAAFGAMPDGATGTSTPLYCGMANFLEPDYAPVFTSSEASSYLILVSDGADFCGEECCVSLNPFEDRCNASAQELRELTTELLAAHIRTFVIGFAGNVSENQLNAIASRGGTAYTKFFDAADGVALADAFATIAGATVSCTYALDEPDEAADPEKVNFYFDDEVVPYDEDCTDGKGWTWSDDAHTEVDFCAGPCDQLRSGNVDTISARFGCPTVVI